MPSEGEPRAVLVSGVLRTLIHFASAVPGVVWPPVPSSTTGAMLAMQYQFERSEWLDRAELGAFQLSQLRALMRHAFQTVPYYQALQHSTGFPADSDFGFDEFQQLPVLTRRDIQDHYSRLVTTRLPAGHGRTIPSDTSGSGGSPLRFLTTDLAQFFFQAFSVRDHLWHRRDLSKKMLAIRVHPYPQTFSSWFPGVEPVPFVTGPLAVVPIHLPMVEQLDRIVAERPVYLLGHASHLIALTEEAIRTGRRIAGVDQVRTFAEMLPVEGRRLMEDYWGANVVDIYTTRECGYIGAQCPDSTVYHVQEGVIVEILRRDGAPCQPGETGRVVVTPLHNFAMPMIRYDLDDLAEAGPPCACGRGLPVLSRIAGRVRNMLRLPDGNSLWPMLGTYRDAIPAIRQRQVVQRSLQELELRLVVDRPLTANEEEGAKAELLARIGHPFQIRLSYVDGFPRSGGGKFEEFRCEIAGVQ